ncbi:MAG: hypothetical protein H0U74_10875 [Bradymonadaceae bacterium]|nr:hypothetical protein [Lujinxingiaceae bacterium]
MQSLIKLLDKWLSRLSYPILIVAALLLGLAPFTPEPHLVETTQMLFEGRLTEPIYIFDFVMHSFPIMLLVVKIARDPRHRKPAPQ